MAQIDQTHVRLPYLVKNPARYPGDCLGLHLLMVAIRADHAVICGIPGEKCPFSVHGTQVICQHLSNGNRPSWQLELISFKIHLIPSQVRDLIP
jgi:hypothetical protein